MDAKSDHNDLEEKGRAYLQRLTHRKNRYEHYLRHGTTEKYRKPVYYKMEKLARMGKLKDLEELEHGKHSERMKYLMMHKSYRHHGDYYAMLMEEMYREGENSEDVSSDEEEIKQQTEEKFKELEEARRKWHIALDKTRFSSVYQTKDILSNYILLGNDYSTERIIAMTDFLKEPVFLSKMCHLAVRWKQPSTLKVLIKFGAWVNIRISSDKNMRTALHAACAIPDYPCIEVLIFSRANPDLRDKFGNTAALLAMHAGCDEATMKLLLYHSKLKLSDHVNEEGVGLFHRCGPFFEEKKGSDDTFKPPVKRENNATYKLMLEKAETSKELAYLINLKDKEGRVPLQDAITVGSFKNVELLLNYGADVRAVDSKGNTVVHLAVSNEKLNAGCLELLLKAGADVRAVNSEGNTALHLAVSNEKLTVECLELLLKGADFSAVDSKGDTVVHLAVSNENAVWLELLLKAGAPVNILNQQKLVPMRMVIEKLVKCTGSKDNLRKIITLLLEYGAPVHIITDDANGDTAFHAIVRLFPPEWDLASTFLEHGASVVKPNYLGEKVRDITVVSKRMDVLLKDKSNRLRSLSEVCKWKIREVLASSHPGPVQVAVHKLTCLPPHLQAYLLTKGFSKPSYGFAEQEEEMDTSEQ